MSTTERHLELPAIWMRLVITGEPRHAETAHLFPAHYYTAFCGFNAERAVGGLLFTRDPAAPDDHQCITCGRVAARSRFNAVDAIA